MSTHRCFPLVLSILSILGVPVRSDAQGGAFRSTVEIVPLTVTVTDGAGRHVKNLTAADFTVFEDGVPQPLALFASGQVPVDLALVLDVSGSMTPHLPIVRRAAGGLVRSLRPGDRAALAAVNHAVTLRQPLTGDLARVDAAIGAVSAHGATALYNGLYVMLKEFERERGETPEIRRQVIVLLSDGIDTASRIGFEDVMQLAQRVGVTIYAVSISGVHASRPRARQDGSTLQAEYAMRSLARDAGGRSYFPRTARELPAIYDDIARELAHQYELGYFPVPASAGASFRRLTVRVENAVTRTRSGYYPRRSTVASAAAHAR